MSKKTCIFCNLEEGTKDKKCKHIFIPQLTDEYISTRQPRCRYKFFFQGEEYQCTEQVRIIVDRSQPSQPQQMVVLHKGRRKRPYNLVPLKSKIIHVHPSDYAEDEYCYYHSKVVSGLIDAKSE